MLNEHMPVQQRQFDTAEKLILEIFVLIINS